MQLYRCVLSDKLMTVDDVDDNDDDDSSGDGMVYLWPSSCAPVAMLPYCPNSLFIDVRSLALHAASYHARPSIGNGSPLLSTVPLYR